MAQVKKSPVEVINDAEVPITVLASAIITIAAGVKKLRGGKLHDRALFLLIQDACAVSVGLETIRKVFDAIGDLEKRYVRK